MRNAPSMHVSYESAFRSHSFEVRMIDFNYGFLVTILIIDFTVECRSR